MQPVVNGVLSDASTDAIVLLTARTGSSSRVCSATVVAPRMIVTARHCVSPFFEGTFTCTLDGTISESDTQSPSNAGVIGVPYEPDQIEVRVGVNPYGEDAAAFGEHIYVVATDTICRNDIALVRLDQEIEVEPRAVRLTEATFPGEEVTVIGYGQKETGNTVVGRAERAGVEILAVGESTLYPQGRNSLPRTFSVGQGPCPGDSGGPALSDAGAVIGVFSLIRGNCQSTTVRNLYTQLAPYRSFIEDAFEDSGMEVIYENPPDTTGGEGGSSGAAGETGTGGGSSGGSQSTSSGGSNAAGGTNSGTSSDGGSAVGGSASLGGSGGSATDGDDGTGGTRDTIRGRRRNDDGCKCGVVGSPAGSLGWLPALLLTWAALGRRTGSARKTDPRV